MAAVTIATEGRYDTQPAQSLFSLVNIASGCVQPIHRKLSVDWFDTLFDASSLLTEGSRCFCISSLMYLSNLAEMSSCATSGVTDRK